MLALLLATGCLAHKDEFPPMRHDNYKDTVNGVSFDMVYVPRAEVWIGRYEVTWDEFELYYLSEQKPEPGVDAIARPTPFYFPHDRGWGRGRMPAIGLTRHAAEQYCAWLSRATGRRYRLPTEEEWLAACGTRPDAMGEYAWTEENSDERTHEVGTKLPNHLGIFDMFGNAWEYCAGETPVLRGGSHVDPARDVGPDARTEMLEEWNDSDPQIPKSVWWLADAAWTGFRIARSVP